MKNFASKRNYPNDKQGYMEDLKAQGVKGFCPVPWCSIGINNNGDFRMCVQASSKKPERGVLSHCNGSTMRVENASIDQARNSELMKEVRRDMIAGKRSDHCTRCNKEDDSGFNSRRWVDLKRYWYEFDIDDAIDNTNEDGSIDTEYFPLLDIDLRLDNTCNLKCRMCGPTESHQWYTEWMKTTGFKGFKSYNTRVALEMQDTRAVIVGNNPYQWTERVDIADMMKNDAPHLRIIYMSGGEPLIIEQQYELLQKYIDSGESKNIEVHYNTNFTSIPQRALDQWDHFKSVHIGGSIDAIGELNNYIRHPSKWEQIEKNIQKLDRETGDNVACWTTYTWQILNATSVTDMIEWTLEQNFTKFNRYSKWPCFTYHPVHNPVHYCVTSLPDSAKEYVSDSLITWRDTWLRNWCNQQNVDWRMSNSDYIMTERNGHKREIITDWDHGIESLYTVISNNLDTMINFMNSKSTVEALPEFWRITKILDASRNENYEELCPEIAGYIKQHLGI
jgi:sulfatase maturation enzyme AslB (radical SAM superfamily)